MKLYEVLNVNETFKTSSSEGLERLKSKYKLDFVSNSIVFGFNDFEGKVAESDKYYVLARPGGDDILVSGPFDVPEVAQRFVKDALEGGNRHYEQYMIVSGQSIKTERWKDDPDWKYAEAAELEPA